MNKKELEYFRTKLKEKERQLVDVVHKTENYGREIDSEGEAMDIADKASSSYTKEFMFSKSNSDRQLLQQVADALNRLGSGDFGTCQQCEEEIGRKRLEAVPWTSLCITCQEKQELGKF